MQQPNINESTSQAALPRSSSLYPPSSATKQALQQTLDFAEFIRVDAQPQAQRYLLQLLNGTQASEDAQANAQKAKKEPRKFSFFGSYHSLTGKSANASAASLIRTQTPIPVTWKKVRSYSLQNLVHLATLAIRDGKQELALIYLQLINVKLFKKGRYAYLFGPIMVQALVCRMEQVCLMLVERGFPYCANNHIFHGQAVTGLDSRSLPSYFMMAVSQGMCQLVKAMLKMKRTSATDQWCSLTALHVAVSKTQTRSQLNGSSQFNSSSRSSTLDDAEDQADDMVRILLEAGADPFAGTSGDAIWILARLQKFGIQDQSAHSNALFSIPQKAVAQYINGPTISSLEDWIKLKTVLPIALASANQNKSAAALLVSKMATLKPRKSEMMSDLYKMQKSFSSSTISSIESLGDRLAASKKDLLSLLVTQDLEICIILMKYAVSETCQSDPYSNNALHLAARNGNIELVNLLLHFDDGLLNSKGQRGFTALMEALTMNHLDIFRLLLRRSASTSITNDFGDTVAELGQKVGMELADINDVWLAPVSKMASNISLTASTIMPGSVGANELLFNLESKLTKLISSTTLPSFDKDNKRSSRSISKRPSTSEEHRSESEDGSSRTKFFDNFNILGNRNQSPPPGSVAPNVQLSSKRTGTLKPLLKGIFRPRSMLTSSKRPELPTAADLAAPEITITEDSVNDLVAASANQGKTQISEEKTAAIDIP